MNETIPELNQIPAGAPAGETGQAAQNPDSVQQFFDEVGDLLVTLGLAAGKVAEDVTGLMVMPVDEQARRDLDVLVEAGLAKSRAQAAVQLLRDGVQSNQSVYEKVERTRAQIDALRSQLRSLVGQG